MAKQPAAVLGTGQTHYVAKRHDVSMSGLVREAIDRAMVISDLCLVEKSGGKSGDFVRTP